MTLQIDDEGELGKLLQLLPEAINTFKQAASVQNNQLTAQW